jgi:hypothetical protein
MKKPTGREVDAKTAASLLKERNGRIDPTFLGRTTIRRYILDDGSALVLAPNGTGHHWDSYDDLMKWVGMLEARAAEGRSALGDVLPLGNDFLNHIPRLVESLPRLLRLERSALDGTEGSLDLIDSLIDGRGPDDFLTADTFQSLVAYVGEVIRGQIDGQWDVRLGADGRTWEPDIVDRQGLKCSLVRIYKEIQERGDDDFDSGNLAAFVRHTIRTHRT